MSKQPMTFEKAYAELAKPLRNFLYYQTGSQEMANDFAQEAFIKFWENMDRVSPGHEKGYLFTIARRLHFDELDRQKVRLKFQYRKRDTDLLMESNPEHIYREEEFKERLEGAISRLTSNQRSIFLMSRIDKLMNKEIAELLNVSIKTVEKHMTNALKQLKGDLDEYHLRRI
ncbi:MAG: sigma-70 family RNA polymerase sigma factor [Bacteroidota bacterium]